MPSLDERREVAARLRETEIEAIGFLDYSAHLGEAIGVCVRLVSGHECLVEDGLARLADLIEPEPERTCRIEYVKHGLFLTFCGLPAAVTSGPRTEPTKEQPSLTQISAPTAARRW